jgi:predicted transcriptional regulator
LGEFDADVRLTEESLSQQLGISKSPIREALNGLEHEGLISIEPRRGAYVRQFTAKEVEDLYKLREVLEVYAVSIAKITPALLLSLKESIKRTALLLKADDRTGHIEEDSRFHSLIAEATTTSAQPSALPTTSTGWMPSASYKAASAFTSIASGMTLREIRVNPTRRHGTSLRQRMRNPEACEADSRNSPPLHGTPRMTRCSSR